MNRIKKLFSTPGKGLVTIACTIAVLVLLGAGTAFAASAIAEGSAIGTENAKNFAFADAGVDPASAGNVRAEFDYEHGQFVYEVEFVAGNSEYEYWIKASNGSVVKKQVEIIKQDGADVTAMAETPSDRAIPAAQSAQEAPAGQPEGASAENISADTAKSKALEDAGLSDSEVTFIQAKLDYDDGVPVYDVEFYTASYEYDYEIDARTGVVRSRETEVIETASWRQGNDQSGSISVEDAKSISLSHAGVSDVTYTKAKLDNEDGQLVYEIEFRKDGVEYEYTIRADDGFILSYDSEWDD